MKVKNKKMNSYVYILSIVAQTRLELARTIRSKGLVGV